MDRGGNDIDSDAPELQIGRSVFLLLEMTGLESPPKPEAAYKIGLYREAETDPAWEEPVLGSMFEENYSLCVLLKTEGLSAGRYRMNVNAPDGAEIYTSRLELR